MLLSADDELVDGVLVDDVLLDDVLVDDVLVDDERLLADERLPDDERVPEDDVDWAAGSSEPSSERAATSAPRATLYSGSSTL